MRKFIPDAATSRLGIGAFAATLLLIAAVAARPGSVAPQFLPHGVCYQWDPNLVRLHLVSDVLIGAAYTAIPFTLWSFLRRRTDLPFNWMFVLFGLFIVACGTTHWMEAWTLWHPDYWLAGSLKAVTAAASVPTAILLYLLVPAALRIPSARQLQEAKIALEKTVLEKDEALAALEVARSELEARVLERTQALTAANAALESQRASLQLANAEQAQFLAVLSHEIRNPLHALRMTAALLKMPLDEAARGAAIEKIERQARWLGELLAGLVDVGKLTARISIGKETTDLAAVVEAALDIVRPQFLARRQVVTSRLDAQAVRCDPMRVEQALVNVLTNAAKFTPEGGKIEVECRAEPGIAIVQVRDYGVGVAAEDLDRIFELFHRGTAGERVDGMGIGLHIVKQIVLAHGGTIAATSEGPGRGTTFTIRLPAQ